MPTASNLFRTLATQGAMIERLSSDSRRCAPGVAFLAYPGEMADGRAHIADALDRGAPAVIWEEQGFAWPVEWRVPNVPVRGLKHQAGRLASEFYGEPSQSLWLCGVTGTNGKTSCSQWTAALLELAGVPSRVIGTLGSGSPGALEPLSNTTPDAIDVQFLLKKFVKEKAEAVAMEVSSHGLAQGRVSAVAFDCALFTNLSHDHLDYHGSMDAYASAKAKLFETPGLQAAVVNLDDVVGVQLARRLTARGVRTIGYSLSPAAIAHGSVREFIAAASSDGARVRLTSSWGEHDATVDQIGRFNVSNALGVLGCLVAYGVPLAQAAGLLAALPAVPGRMERVGERPLVVVDYAHTPDALEKVLQALRPVADSRGGRLVAVFGAGGDRDPAKRPLMGAIASRLAERLVITSDNPRSEDPMVIVAEVLRGVANAHRAQPDRGRAIEEAILEASPADVVLIAGKGHENYQEIAGKRIPFSDVGIARSALAKRGQA